MEASESISDHLCSSFDNRQEYSEIESKEKNLNVKSTQGDKCSINSEISTNTEGKDSVYEDEGRLDKLCNEDKVTNEAVSKDDTSQRTQSTVSSRFIPEMDNKYEDIEKKLITASPQSYCTYSPSPETQYTSPKLYNSKAITSDSPPLSNRPRKSEHQSGVPGVYWQESSQRWIAQWSDSTTGRRITHGFSARVYGFEEAKQMAIRSRLDAIENGKATARKLYDSDSSNCINSNLNKNNMYTPVIAKNSAKHLTLEQLANDNVSDQLKSTLALNLLMYSNAANLVGSFSSHLINNFNLGNNSNSYTQSMTSNNEIYLNGINKDLKTNLSSSNNTVNGTGTVFFEEMKNLKEDEEHEGIFWHPITQIWIAVWLNPITKETSTQAFQSEIQNDIDIARFKAVQWRREMCTQYSEQIKEIIENSNQKLPYSLNQMIIGNQKVTPTVSNQTIPQLSQMMSYLGNSLLSHNLLLTMTSPNSTLLHHPHSFSDLTNSSSTGLHGNSTLNNYKAQLPIIDPITIATAISPTGPYLAQFLHPLASSISPYLFDQSLQPLATTSSDTSNNARSPNPIPHSIPWNISNASIASNVNTTTIEGDSAKHSNLLPPLVQNGHMGLQNNNSWSPNIAPTPSSPQSSSSITQSTTLSNSPMLDSSGGITPGGSNHIAATTLSANYKSGIPGVYWKTRDQEWVAEWYDQHRKRHSRHFYVKKYGFEEAKRLAIQCRLRAVASGEAVLRTNTNTCSQVETSD
ncbi:AP2 domain-containing protein [Cryptosporidium andersoni]|uniref:AP2 domain-containing protein n=1 Tax=Cryptosporidium andersoni TaxID=117008 RepID=A0A1J4MFX9_9CRYT|nr:AP2 domain-containing protein [Cryptosporidium andersoni]